MIEADRGNRNQGENRRRNTGRDHPSRKRSIDETLHSRPTREERVRPKTNRGQMVTVNGASDYFWNHVIGRAESDRAEPKKKQIIRVPPAYRCLQDALDRHDKSINCPAA